MRFIYWLKASIWPQSHLILSIEVVQGTILTQWVPIHTRLNGFPTLMVFERDERKYSGEGCGSIAVDDEIGV